MQAFLRNRELIGGKMINILLEGYNIDEPWLYDALKGYLKPTHRVAVVAFSFRDTSVRNASDWMAFYGKENGRFYKAIVKGIGSYGIPSENISFINYFTDTMETAKEIIKEADILYFLGGLPDKMMERIREFELTDTLARFDGIVMGYSAGALIQLAEYHLSPDRDYPEFGYYGGLPYLKGFYLEVHYEGRDEQNEAIRRVLSERNAPVYATASMRGAIIVDAGVIKPLGDVRIFK